MSMLGAFFATLGKIQPITVSSDWGANAGASPQTSASRTMTVPGGNPGVIKFTSVSSTGTFEYRKNAGAYATVTEGGTVSVATSDTINFRLTGISSDGASVTVIDNTVGSAIGSWSGTII